MNLLLLLAAAALLVGLWPRLPERRVGLLLLVASLIVTWLFFASERGVSL